MKKLFKNFGKRRSSGSTNTQEILELYKRLWELQREESLLLQKISADSKRLDFVRNDILDKLLMIVDSELQDWVATLQDIKEILGEEAFKKLVEARKVYHKSRIAVNCKNAKNVLNLFAVARPEGVLLSDSPEKLGPGVYSVRIIQV
jgi:hypothetical protein